MKISTLLVLAFVIGCGTEPQSDPAVPPDLPALEVARPEPIAASIAPVAAEPDPRCEPVSPRVIRMNDPQILGGAEVVVFVSAWFATISVATQAQRCPAARLLERVAQCIASPRCGSVPKPDELISLRQLALQGVWDGALVGQERVDVVQAGTRTLVALGGEADVTATMMDLFTVPKPAIGASGGAGALPVPCLDLAPCNPMICPTGGNPGPRVQIIESTDELPLEDCDCESLLCDPAAPPPAQDCACLERCTSHVCAG